MKKAAAVFFIVVFAAAMFHFFFGEDHGSVCFPSVGGGYGQVHHDHGHASTCLCFLNTLFVPENDDWDGSVDFRVPLVPADECRLYASFVPDIAHPPNSSLL